MKKFTWLLAVAFCFPIVSFTGCGDGENKLVEPPAEVEEISDAEQDEFDKGMEEAMNQPG